jgi:hypothetical protein
LFSIAVVAPATRASILPFQGVRNHQYSTIVHPAQARDAKDLLSKIAPR